MKKKKVGGYLSRKNMVLIMSGITITVGAFIIITIITSFSSTKKNIDSIPSNARACYVRDSTMNADFAANNKSQQIQIDAIRDTSNTVICEVLEEVREIKKQNALDRVILKEICKRTKGLEIYGRLMEGTTQNNEL